MFRLAPLPTFQRTVTVHVPSETKADEFEAQTLTMTFRALGTEELRRLDQQWLQLPEGERVKNLNYQLKAVIVGWDGVVDADGNPITYSAASLDQALDTPWFAQAAGAAYRKAIDGDAARLGN